MVIYLFPLPFTFIRQKEKKNKLHSCTRADEDEWLECGTCFDICNRLCYSYFGDVEKEEEEVEGRWRWWIKHCTLRKLSSVSWFVRWPFKNYCRGANAMKLSSFYGLQLHFGESFFYGLFIFVWSLSINEKTHKPRNWWLAFIGVLSLELNKIVM